MLCAILMTRLLGSLVYNSAKVCHRTVCANTAIKVQPPTQDKGRENKGVDESKIRNAEENGHASSGMNRGKQEKCWAPVLQAAFTLKRHTGRRPASLSKD